MGAGVAILAHVELRTLEQQERKWVPLIMEPEPQTIAPNFYMTAIKYYFCLSHY